MKGAVRIGLDVGGTFTDLFLLDDRTGEAMRHKLSSTPEDPYRAPIQGIREILSLAKREASEVSFVGLGTTVATNALLERKVARTGLLTTTGFRDLLEIGRQRRPDVYNMFARRPEPLVPRELRLEVEERIAADGSVLVPLNGSGVAMAVEQLRGAGCTSIAVCFLNAYANPEHERRAAEILRRLWPEVSATISSELLPEFREYERLSSTVINAALIPVMQNYLQRFQAAVRELGVPTSPWVMSSGGGVSSPELAASRPIDTLLSGPSGGVSGSLHISHAAGVNNLITFDMGGTSTDVCLIRDGRPEVTQSRSVDGLPIKSAAVDVHTVGAGGSSLAWVDAGGLLRVGPHSAGAKPGPACYGAGGDQPTVTDANVVLGRLNQTHLLGGALAIDMKRSVAAIEQVVAKPKGLSLHEAAAAIIAISNTNIAQAIRFVSVERGLDPADFTLVAFGGAGPLHAAEVARELRMRVLIPPSPGVLCAIGVLTKDVQIDLGQTSLMSLSESSTPKAAAAVFGALAERASTMLSTSGQQSESPTFEYTVDARYVGQNFELRIVLPPLKDELHLVTALRAGFDAEHRRLYGYDQPEKEVELVTLRLRATLPMRTASWKEASADRSGKTLRAIDRRRVYFPDHGGFLDCPIYARETLQLADGALRGPLIVEQMDTTTVVPPGFVCRVDAQMNLILENLGADPAMHAIATAELEIKSSTGRDEIIASGLEAVAWEMCASLIRTAYSPNVKERADCSTALCDLTGRTLALATYAPAHLGSTLKLVPAILDRFPLREMRPGDAFLANDPYIVGVTHLNDCTFAAPIFVGGKPVAFAAAVAHHSDVGGRVPGSESGDSTSIYQEGIRIPPVKLMEQGKLRSDVWEMVLLNSRTPHYSEGDLRAQTAANDRGAQRLQAMYERYGEQAMEAAIGNMLDATERRARSQIKAVLRPGKYSAEDWLDEDGISDNPVHLAVDLTVGDGELTFDFSRCAAQLGSGKNIPYTHLMATVYFCTIAMIDPALSVNEGLYRTIRVISPEGNVTNPRPPGGVGSRNLTSMILADAIMNAFGQAAPDRATAAGGPYQGIIVSGLDPRRKRFYVDYENYAGGQGGSAIGDGADVMQLHTTNTSNLPVEVTELEFPMRVERYEMICDSGGPGRHRGGLGVRRDLRIVAPNAILALRSARQRFAAGGLLGGKSGRLGSYRLNPGEDGAGERLPSTLSEYQLEHDALLRIETPGGGGYGDPRERDPARVAREVLQGKISVVAARDIYAVEVTADGHLDTRRTDELRSLR